MSTTLGQTPIGDTAKKRISLRLHRKNAADASIRQSTESALLQNEIPRVETDRSNAATSNTFDTTSLVLSLPSASPNDKGNRIPSPGSPIQKGSRRNNRVMILSSDGKSDDEFILPKRTTYRSTELNRSTPPFEHQQSNGDESLVGASGNVDNPASQDLDKHQEPTASSADKFAPVEVLDKIRNCALLDGKCFALAAEVSTTDHMQVSCQMCPGKKILIGSLKSTTNLLKHLKRLLPDNHVEYLAYKDSKRSEKRQRDSSTVAPEPPTKRRKKIQYSSRQDDFEDSVLMFIIETMTPLSIIDQPSFKRLFNDAEDRLVSRGTITRRMVEMDEKRLKKTRDLLTKSEYVCTTAKRRSFIGVTGFPLACRRFDGTHAFDKIADALENIHRIMLVINAWSDRRVKRVKQTNVKPGINDKQCTYDLSNTNIVATITDNASNFVKAFREFGVRAIGKIRQYSCDDEEDDNELDASSDSDFEDTASFDTESAEVWPRLSQHLRCSTHTLNLIATSDVMSTMKKDTHVANRHSRTMAKCTQLCHKAALPKSAEIISATVGHTFSYPILTRWNSFYDSLHQISKEKAALPSLCERLCLNDSSTTNDVVYIEEYCRVMEPMVRAVDILQGEDKVYYGILLPTLLTLKYKLQNLSKENLKYGRVLANVCLSGLTIRFQGVLSFDVTATNAIIATVSHPAFKLKWFCQANMQYKLKLPLDKIRDTFLNGARFFVDDSHYDIDERNNSGSISSFLTIV